MHNGNSDNKETYHSKRRGGRNKTTAPFTDDSTADKNIQGKDSKNEASSVESLGHGTDTQTDKARYGIKNPADYNLKQDKGADLQQEAGADLTSKSRLKEKSGIDAASPNLPTYGSYIRNRRKYNKHAAKVKQYTQPYESTLTVKPDDEHIKSESAKSEETTSDENISGGYTGDAEDSRRNEVKETDGNESGGSTADSDAGSSDDADSKSSKLQTDKSKLGADKKSKLETKSRSKLTDDEPIPASKLTADKKTSADKAADPKGKTQKDVNRKKQHSQVRGRYINTSKPPDSIKEQHKLHNKADRLTKKSSKLHKRREDAITKMPTKTVKTKKRVYDEATGKMSKLKTTETRTMHQSETRWNNPKFTDTLRNAEGVKEKAKVIAKSAGETGAVLGTAGAAGAIAGIGVAPAVAGTLVAKPALEYGSKLMVNVAHRQVRKDIQQSDNEVLKAAHWAEQKGERALGHGIRKLNPVAVRRYIKNAPYRRESKLQIKQLKNDKKLGLMRVKLDKETGINHMSGKKSNVVTRAWQKRQIKRNYQKAMLAAKGKSGGALSAMAREISRGNPKAIVTILAKKIAFVAARIVAKLTIFNPLFWKLMLLVLIFLIILGSVQACAVIFAPSLAGVGFVSDDDIDFSTRAYSEWEVDMQLYLADSNITSEYPPPSHITSQPGVNGEVVYPEPPYTPPPPFYEYRFEVGVISHDPMELISYLTAVYGERFDKDSANPMTRSDLEAILKEIFEAQYGIAPGDFDTLIHEEVETRYRRERRTVTEIRYDAYGSPYLHEEEVFEDIYYEFWILTVRLEPRSLSDVLRNRMSAEEEMHFDVLNLTGNGRQVVGNPFNFNWLPNITSHYGYRINPTGSGKQLHMGIDIGAALGTQIFATHTGTITEVQFSDSGYGNMIRLNGEGNNGIVFETLFAHLHEIHVTQGQEVTQGDLIATVGSTGDSTGPHLHLEVFRPSQQIIEGGTTTTLPEMQLNPIFAVITWTDDESNEAFRPAPGASGTRPGRPPYIPHIPPEAMSDERFAAILAEASRHLGKKYVWGAVGANTFDCSGFIHYTLSNAGIGWTHGRETAQGYYNMSTLVTAENARPGDLVFFHGTHSGAFITHVGIYIGNNQMVHIGGNPAGVEFVNIGTAFWQSKFYAFGRLS